MDWAAFIVQWLHVFAGVTWFGSVIYADFILIPAITTLPLDVQRAAGGAIGVRAAKVIPGVALGVIVLGVLRGTVWGPIKSFDALATEYGLTWLVALVLAIITFAYGKLLIEPAIDRLNAIPASEAVLPGGSPNPAMSAAVANIKRITLLELALFLAIFTCMILMRFGR